MIAFNIFRKYKNTRHWFTSLYYATINGYPGKKMRIIGVTGTDGKTTTCHLIYNILKDAGIKVGLISTVAAYINNEVIDTGFHVTTPDAKLLQPILKKMYLSGVECVVLETTSHAIDQYRNWGCRYWGVVFTNITHEHLDYHKTFENYREVKSRLLRNTDFAVLNQDDESYSYLKNRSSKKTKIISYSLVSNANIHATNIKSNDFKQTFDLWIKNKKYHISTPLLGKYNISNILAAIGIAQEFGIQMDKVVTTLKEYSNIPGRMNVVSEKGPKVYVDFAHTPNALLNVLTTLKKKLPKNGRLICIFGCAGERDVTKRPLMGEISTRYAKVSIFTAEDPRHEDVNTIIDEIVAGVDKKKSDEVLPKNTANFENNNRNVFIRIPDRKKAIFYALRNISKEKDIVVVCGKGHEKSMAYGNVEKPWDDFAVCKSALES